MTIHRYLNKRQETGHAVFWFLTRAMKDAGWTVPRSGSGQGGGGGAGTFALADVFGYFARGNECITGIGVGQDGFCGRYGWIVMQDPDGNRQILFEHSRSGGTDVYDSYWTVAYSPGGLYTGGDAITPPTATDELIIVGDHGTGSNIFTGGGVPNMVHAVADDTPSPHGEYGFLVLNLQSVNSQAGYCFLDDLRQAAAGDPAALVLCARSGDMEAADMYNRNFWAQVDVGGAGEDWETVAYSWPSIGGAEYQDIPAGASRYDQKERPLPIFACDPDIGGYLGASRWFRASPVGAGTRHYNTQEGKTLITMMDTVIVDFWDGSSFLETI